jgi:hypothetical protein
MWKSILFLCLRAAAGYILVSLIFLAATFYGSLPKETYEVPGNSTYYGFFLGTLIAWIAGTLLAIAAFAGWSPRRLSGWLAWAPLYWPPLYAAASYVWFTQISAP